MYEEQPIKRYLFIVRFTKASAVNPNSVANQKTVKKENPTRLIEIHPTILHDFDLLTSFGSTPKDPLQ